MLPCVSLLFWSTWQAHIQPAAGDTWPNVCYYTTVAGSTLEQGLHYGLLCLVGKAQREVHDKYWLMLVHHNPNIIVSQL